MKKVEGYEENNIICIKYKIMQSSRKKSTLFKKISTCSKVKKYVCKNNKYQIQCNGILVVGKWGDRVADTEVFIAICNVLFHKLRSGYTGVDYFILYAF